MVDSIADALGMGLVVAATTATYGFFHWFGSKEVSDEAKAAVSRWFSNRRVKATDVRNAYAEVFYGVYSPVLLSWRALRRSAFFSMFLFAIYLLIEYMTTDFFLGSKLGYVGYKSVILLANIISDFVSLFIIARWLSDQDQSSTSAIFRAIIAAAGVVIAIYCVKLIVSITANVMQFPVFEFSLVREFTHLVFQNELETFESRSLGRILNKGALWPALAVHAWIPIMALSMVALKGLTYVGKYIQFFRWLLKDGKENPFEAIAYAAACVVFVVGTLWKVSGAVRV